MFSPNKALIGLVQALIASALVSSSVSYAQEITGYVVYEKAFNSPSSLIINDEGLPPAPDLGNNTTQGAENVPVYDAMRNVIGYTHRSATMRWTEQIILTNDDIGNFKTSGKKYTIRVLVDGEASRFPKFPGMLYEDDAGTLAIFARITCDGPVGSKRYSKGKSERSILTDSTWKFSYFKTWDDFDINACAGPLRLSDAYVSGNRFHVENFIVQLIEL